MNATLLVSVPVIVVTVTGPEVAPAGTVTVIAVPEEPTLKVAAVPLKWTAVAPVKSVPRIVTLAPTLAEGEHRLNKGA